MDTDELDEAAHELLLEYLEQDIDYSFVYENEELSELSDEETLYIWKKLTEMKNRLYEDERLG